MNPNDQPDWLKYLTGGVQTVTQAYNTVMGRPSSLLTGQPVAQPAGNAPPPAPTPAAAFDWQKLLPWGLAGLGLLGLFIIFRR